MASATEDQIFLTPRPLSRRERGEERRGNHRQNPPLSLWERGHGVRVIRPLRGSGHRVLADGWAPSSLPRLLRFLDTSRAAGVTGGPAWASHGARRRVS